jgi:ADP-ribose pyrophosphatase YjhB (NUDIX family)
MKVTRSTTADGRPGEDATHVLHWLPPYLASDRRGRWELQTAGDYQAGAPALGESLDAPRDADAGTLAAWAAGQLGYRVDLELAWATFAAVTPTPPFLHGGKEPVWYARAAHYTSPDVLQAYADGGPGDGDWADPPDPAMIDWPFRQAAAAIWFNVTAAGRPVSPFGPARVRHGRNELGRWGENLAADAVVTATYAGIRWLLMVERCDGYGWAVPGGGLEAGETGTEAAIRELAEETGLAVTGPSACRPLRARYVPDPRESGEAWAVTIPVLIDLGTVGALPAVTGGDDAARAEWVAARDYACVEAALALDHAGGRVFAAHVPMLRDLVDGPAYTACEQLFARRPDAVRDLPGGSLRKITIAVGSNGELIDLIQDSTPWGRTYRLHPEDGEPCLAEIRPGNAVVAAGDDGACPSGLTTMLLDAAPAQDFAAAR